MNLHSYSARVHTQDRGKFDSLRDSNVLIYFPHGFGDWVQFSYVTRFLPPTNNYWMVRYGDDTTSLMEGHSEIVPVYLGINSPHCGHGEAFSNRHFGLHFNDLDGTMRELYLPRSLFLECQRQNIGDVLWHGFPEVHGRAEFPYHTKPRHLIPQWATSQAISEGELSQPLASSINFEVAPEVQRWVEARLMNFTGWGARKLCMICRNGYTSIGKNWGHLFREDLPPWQRHEGYECREFMRSMLRKDPEWSFLIMEDRLFDGDNTVRDPDLHAFAYAEVFGVSHADHFPFGWIMKAILNCVHLSIGVPVGPYHLSMAKADLPTIGLWIEHLPSWYDEPNANSLHLVSRNVRDRGFKDRPGSFLSHGGLNFSTVELETRTISGEHVLSAVESLLY